jgi:HSP20 family protein
MKLELWDDVWSLERQLDDVFRPFFAFPMTPVFAGGLIPPVDAFYKGGNLIVHMELPGIDPEKVKLTVEQDILVIRGERARREKVEKEHFVQMERSYGTFERRIAIPTGVDEAQIGAEYCDGVLEITVPLPEDTRAEPKTIPIHATAKT